MNILDYIPKGRENAISREKLRQLTGLTDSKMRELIRQARHDVPIVNLQSGEGYFIPTNIFNINLENIIKILFNKYFANFYFNTLNILIQIFF